MTFVMIGEVPIYVPSISRYRLVYLEERLTAVHQATLALRSEPDGMVTPELEADLLIHSRVHSVELCMPAASYQMLGTAPAIDTTFDLREETAYRLIRDDFVTLIQPRNRVLRVSARPTSIRAFWSR